jgi:lipoate-protein ligase A
MPSRQPDYRINRSHADFLINLNIPVPTVSGALIKAWDATAPLIPIPSSQITLLAREKYSLDEWNLRF